MTNFLLILRRNRLLQLIASMPIAVGGLLLLFILTFWGTVAQVEIGLFAAQERYFSSMFFLAMGFLPFPGGQLVLWVLFANLLAAFFTRIIYSGEKLGLILTHIGLILFLVSAFLTMHQAEESHLTLREGESANVSRSYTQWELAVWPLSGEGTRSVYALDINGRKSGEELRFSELALNFRIKEYHPNSQAFTNPDIDRKEQSLNASGITVLKPKPLDKEQEKNVPGIILETDASARPLLLYGLEDQPVRVEKDARSYAVQLRQKRFPLPIHVHLVDFMMDKHPGTEIARSYQSQVKIEHSGLTRDVLISMNEPFRFKDYTFYQASYQIDQLGREASTLAVVKNSGRILPYVATFVTFIGLFYHFLVAAFKYKRTSA